MRKEIRRAHAADRRQRGEAADEDQRHPVGDGHGQEIARGGERHHRRKQRQSESIGDHDHCRGAGAYLNASWTKVELSFEPSPCTTAMIATEMPAATRPYSTAVAPDSSCTKRFRRLIILPPRFTTDALGSGGRYRPADPKPGRTLAGPTLQRG